MPQLVKRSTYWLPNNYWDWQIGIGATVYSFIKFNENITFKVFGTIFDLSVAYVDTKLSVAGCGNTMNCDARALFIVSKTF